MVNPKSSRLTQENKERREALKPLISERKQDRLDARGLAGRLIAYSSRIPVAQKYADAILSKAGATAVYIETKGSTVLSGENGSNRARTVYNNAVKEIEKQVKERQTKRQVEFAQKNLEVEATAPDLTTNVHKDGKFTIFSVKLNPHTYIHLNLGDTDVAQVDKVKRSVWPLIQKFRTQLRSISIQEKALYSQTTGLGSKVAMEKHEQDLRKSGAWSKGCLGFFDLVKFKSANDKWGMQIGDRLIAKSAELHKGVARNTDALFTPTGDELYLVAPNKKEEAETTYLKRLDEYAHANWRKRSVRERLEELGRPLIDEPNAQKLIEDKKINAAEKELKTVIKNIDGIDARRFSHLDLSNIHNLLNSHYRGETDDTERKVVHAIASNPATQWLVGLQLYQRAIFHDLAGLNRFGEAEARMGDEIKDKKKAFAAHWGMPVERSA